MPEGNDVQLPMVIPQPAAPPSLEERLAMAEQREEAIRLVLRAVITSIRPFGFNRTKFKRCVAEEGQDTPTSGPKSARHDVLHHEARRVLRETR